MKTYITIVLLACALSGCFLENKEMTIREVSKPTSWIYWQVPLLFERQFDILIDGELDNMAALETQHRGIWATS